MRCIEPGNIKQRHRVCNNIIKYKAKKEYIYICFLLRSCSNMLKKRKNISVYMKLGGSADASYCIRRSYIKAHESLSLILVASYLCVVQFTREHLRVNTFVYIHLLQQRATIEVVRSSHFHVDMVQLRFIYPRTDNEPHYIGVVFKRYMVKFICSSATSYTHTHTQCTKEEMIRKDYIFHDAQKCLLYTFSMSPLSIFVMVLLYMHKLI